MDETLPMNCTQSCSESDRYTQEPNQIDRLSLVLLDDLIEGFAAWVPKNESRAPFVMSQRNRLSSPSRIEFGRQGVFVLEAAKIPGWRRFGG